MLHQRNITLSQTSDRLDLGFHDENLIRFLWDSWLFLKLNSLIANTNGVFCFFFILVVNIEHHSVLNGSVMVNVRVFYIEIIGSLFADGDHLLAYKHYQNKWCIHITKTQRIIKKTSSQVRGFWFAGCLWVVWEDGKTSTLSLFISSYKLIPWLLGNLYNHVYCVTSP